MIGISINECEYVRNIRIFNNSLLITENNVQEMYTLLLEKEKDYEEHLISEEDKYWARLAEEKLEECRIDISNITSWARKKGIKLN